MCISPTSRDQKGPLFSTKSQKKEVKYVPCKRNDVQSCKMAPELFYLHICEKSCSTAKPSNEVPQPTVCVGSLACEHTVLSSWNQIGEKMRGRINFSQVCQLNFSETPKRVLPSHLDHLGKPLSSAHWPPCLLSLSQTRTPGQSRMTITRVKS